MNWGYAPPLWLRGGHIQTIYPALFARYICSRPVYGPRTRIKTEDNDFVDIDWSENALQKDSLYVMFHGLEGDSKSHYALAFANHMQVQNYGFCVPHFRGCSGEINLSPRAYYSGDFEEIGWVLGRIRSLYEGPIWAVGVSLGGNALLRWAQEAGADAQNYLSGVVAICAPLDLMQSGLQIGRGINHWLYEKRFLKTMKEKALLKIKQFPGLFQIERVMGAKSLYEFDNYFTAPLHGFRDTKEYWTSCSSNTRLRDIRINHLVINALNDPFIPAASLPSTQDFNKYGTQIYTGEGGHVGFVNSSFPGQLNALPELVTQWTKS